MFQGRPGMGLQARGPFLFNPRGQVQFGKGLALSGGQHGVAALPLPEPIPSALLLPDLGESSARLADRLKAGAAGLDRLRDRIEARLHRFDLAPDLAEDIGSATWFRGLGTFLGLTGLALAFWPDFTAVEAATAMPVRGEAREEFRSQAILPLAMGADTGRHMGATPLVAPLAAVPERPMIRMTATMGQGDSFGRMLQRAGVGAGDAAQVTQMVAGAVPLAEIGPGTRFDITLGRRTQAGVSRPLDRLDFRARFDLALAIDRRDGELGLTPRPIAVDATPLRIRGTVGASLYRSARAAGAPVKAVQDYLRALDSHLSLEGDIAADDKFDFVIAYKRAASGEAEIGHLLYAGLESGGKPRVQLLRWGKDGQMFEASGMGRQSAGLVSPVNGRMTSGYGLRRHPVLGYTRMHAGVDFGAAWGTPIFAVSDGVVAYAGRHGGHGNYVKLDHGGGIGTGYAHMSRIAVAPGGRVHTGQVIGYVGSTGLSTGPHLHYELYKQGRTVDPLTVRFSVRAQVDKQELAAFKARLAQLKGVAPGAALKSLAPRQAEVRGASSEIAKLQN